MPYTLGVHAYNDENPHAHLIVSEGASDGIDRNQEQWFKRADPDQPEGGGEKKPRTPTKKVAGGVTERVGKYASC